MRKKINVDDLVVGMYVAEIEGGWMNSPFWRSSFVISDVKEIEQIRDCKVRNVWVDPKRGTNVAQAPSRTTAPTLTGVATVPATAIGLAAGVVDTQPELFASAASGTVDIQEELARASNICAQTKVAVESMFREARMGNTVDGEGVRRVVQEITESLSRNGSALISLARIKTADDYTYMHSVAVCAMMLALARQLGLNEENIRAAGIAGLLHDMGKALLPTHVLNKPGKLTAAEFEIVKSHPERGHRLLSKDGNASAMTLDVCLHHHEKIDGSGYPKGLKGEAISLYAKMGAVCDVYDAITSNRPYKTGWDPAESMRMMSQWAGVHFDSIVFQAFVKSLGIYPVGSLVRLASGRLGVVMDQTSASLTMPIVKVFFDSKTSERITPEIVDLSNTTLGERISAREDPAKWNFPDINELWSGLSGLD